MTKSNTENHRGSCPPLLGRTGDLLGNIYCDLKDGKHENKLVRTVLHSFEPKLYVDIEVIQHSK